MADLYPLRFEPIFRRYLWGGRRLESVLGKAIGPQECAESWELVDHGDDQSMVSSGPLAGTSLHRLIEQFGESLMGQGRTDTSFPLLLKFLDANRTLSVQVHPNDEQGAQLDPPDLGKTEAWVVLHAEPGSVIYAGLKRGFDQPALERELSRGTCELCLHKIEPKAGDCVFIPAGLVHALGEGLVIAELQQASDTTFRLFDWNRVDRDGQPRPLHIEQAMKVIDFEHGPAVIRPPEATDRAHVRRLVACDKFVWDRWQFDTPQPAGGDGSVHLLAVLDGEVRVAGDVAEEPLKKGDTVLLPASLGAVELTPRGNATLLDAYLP
jgi:mannose-6-phosphate isomerase